MPRNLGHNKINMRLAIYIVIMCAIVASACAFPKVYTKRATLFIGKNESVLLLGAGGRWLAPISADGLFPRYSATTAIFMIGLGKSSILDKRNGTVFGFPECAWDRYEKVKDGSVFIASDRTVASINVVNCEEGWPAVLNGEVSIERTYPVITGGAAEMYLGFYRKSTKDVIRMALDSDEKKSASTIPVSDLVVSFLFNEHIGSFQASKACELHGIIIIWSGKKGTEYNIWKVLASEKSEFLKQISTLDLPTPYAGCWQSVSGKSVRQYVP